MADKPIIFSAPMVRALLDGRKTQTRRVLKPQPIGTPEFYLPMSDEDAFWATFDEDERCTRLRLLYAPGDRLWVREAVCWVSRWGWRYRADDDDLRDKRESGEVGRWTSPIHMPRWASRITLTVTDVRVQRLQEISEADAVAEGCEATGWRPTYGNPDNTGFEESIPATDDYASLWNSLHGSGAWDANPWVAAYSFTVQRGNIDGPKETTND